jgi:hypothetical protein
MVLGGQDVITFIMPCARASIARCDGSCAGDWVALHGSLAGTQGAGSREALHQPIQTRQRLPQAAWRRCRQSLTKIMVLGPLFCLSAGCMAALQAEQFLAAHEGIVEDP